MLSQTYDRLEPMVLQFFNSTGRRIKEQSKGSRGWTGSARGRERKRDRTESD